MNKLLTAALGLAVASTAFLAVAAPAQAVTVCEKPGYQYFTEEIPDVVVSAKGTGKVRLDAEVVDNCHQTTSIVAGITSPLQTDQVPLDKVHTEKDVDFYVAVLELPAKGLANAEAGTWKLHVVGRSGSTVNDDLGVTGQFRVLRASTLTAKGSAAKVKKNANVTISATLARADWEKATTPAYAKQKVDLQLQSGKTFKTTKTLTTDAKGTVKASFKVTKTACYRAVYKGNSTTAAKTSGTTCVKLK